MFLEPGQQLPSLPTVPRAAACSVSSSGFSLLTPHSQEASRAPEASGNLPAEMSPSRMATSRRGMAPHADGQILVVKPRRKEAMRELLLAKALSLDTGSLFLGQMSADVTWVGGGKINSILSVF